MSRFVFVLIVQLSNTIWLHKPRRVYALDYICFVYRLFKTIFTQRQWIIDRVLKLIDI